LFRPPSENSAPLITVREVLPKETKYAIAKQYGITVQEFERQNPEIKKGASGWVKLNNKPPTNYLQKVLLFKPTSKNRRFYQ
jgi:hypothetical protein